MAINTGDLTPRASGAASLGVEQIGVCGFTTDIRPFCHVHMNSGVFHGHRGASGVIRYNNGQLERSNDGGLTFEPLAAAVLVDLQEAYDGGNAVTPNSSVEDFGPAITGIVVGDIPGATEFLDTDNQGRVFDIVLDINRNYAFAASGYTETPEDPGSYAITAIRPEGILIRGSGEAASAVNVTPTIFLGTISLNPALSILSTSGLLSLSATLGMQHFTPRDITISATGNPDGINSNILISTNKIGGVSSHDITLQSVEDVICDAAHKVELDAYGGSGILEYRFGTHRGWHVRNLGEDIGGGPQDPAGAYWPLPHSGQIESMIATEIAAIPDTSLQQAYAAGNQIVVAGDQLNIVADADDVFFGSNSDLPSITVSGTLAARDISEGLHVGLNGFFHNMGPHDPQGVTTSQELAAEAIGYHSLTITTGSGVVQLVDASGIQRFTNNAATVIATFPATTNVDFSLEDFEPDIHYEWDATATGVRILTPGTYLALGRVTITNSALATLFLGMSVNGTQINGLGDVGNSLAGTLYAGTIGGIINMQAGDLLTAVASTSAAGSSSLTQGFSTLNLFRLGPPRGQP